MRNTTIAQACQHLQGLMLGLLLPRLQGGRGTDRLRTPPVTQQVAAVPRARQGVSLRNWDT